MNNVPIAAVRHLSVDLVKNLLCDSSKILGLETVKFVTRSWLEIANSRIKVMGPRFRIAEPRVPAL